MKITKTLKKLAKDSFGRSAGESRRRRHSRKPEQSAHRQPEQLEARCLLSGTGYFVGGQRLAGMESYGVDLGDLDGDGDLDAFLANMDAGGFENPFSGAPNTVWLNDGSGSFTDSGQNLGDGASLHMALGDLNGDGALDAFVANAGANTAWLNNGSGTFTDSGQTLGDGVSTHVALADLDGDGDLDAAVTNQPFGTDGNADGEVWINNGAGAFTSGGTNLWSQAYGIALGDVDGDGDNDAFVTRFIDPGDDNPEVPLPDQIWLNQGDGTFSESGQTFEATINFGLALADFDGDGDLDGVAIGPNSMLLVNQGGSQSGTEGVFQASEFNFGSFDGDRIAVADLDGDTDLDIFLTGASGNNTTTDVDQVLFNQGGAQGGTVGTFEASDQLLTFAESADVALGDVNGDGAIDVLVGISDDVGGTASRVWLNQARPVIRYPVNGNVPIDVPASDGLLDRFSGVTISNVNTTSLAGTLNVDQATGAFDFTPATDFVGSDTFTIELSDSRTFIVAMDVSPAVPPTLIDVTSFTRLGPLSLASLAELEAVEITGPGHIVEFTVPIDSVATVYAVPDQQGAELTITVPEFGLSATSSESLGDAAILPPTILPTPEFEQQYEDEDRAKVYTFRVTSDRATSFDIGFYQNTAIEYVDRNTPVILDVNYVSEITAYTQGPLHTADGGATMQCDLNAGKQVGDVETGTLQLQRYGNVVVTEYEDGGSYFYEYNPSTRTISGFFGFGDETHDGFFTGSSTDEENYAWDAASSTFVGTFVERGFLSWIIDDRESNCVTEYAVTLTPSGTQEETDAFLDDTLNDSLALDIDFEWEISAYTQGPLHSSNGGTAMMQCDFGVGKEVGDIETGSYRLHRYGNVVIAEFEDGQAAFYHLDPLTLTVSGYFEYFDTDDIFTDSETDDESHTWDPSSSTFVGTYVGHQYLSWTLDDRESNCVTEHDVTLTPTGTQEETDAFLADGHGQHVEPFFRHTDGNPGAYVIAGISDIASGPDVDDYFVELINGQVVDVLLGSNHEPGRFRNETLELLSPTGTVVATGRPDLIAAEVNSTNVDLGILGFDVPASGQYTLRVTSNTAGNYQVAAITERTFNVEPDEGATGLQRNITDSGHNIGFLDAASDPHDFVEVDLIGGESYQFRTWTQLGSLDSPDKLPLNELDPEIRILAADGTELAHDQNSGCYNNGQLTFTPPADGTYTVQISAESSFGEYSVSYRSAAVASFERLEPLGSLLAVSSTDVGNLCTGEVTELTVELDGDQAISGFLDGTDLSTEFSIEIVGIMDEVASENGDGFFKFGPHQIPETGTYTVRIHNTGHPTNVSLGLVVNAAVDFNATDDNTPIPTDGSLISGANGGRWAAVSNAKRADDGSTNTDTDDFTIDLTGYAGETIDVLLTGIEQQAFDGATLQLLNPAGTVIATGATTPLPNNATATNIDQGIFDFEVPADGVYTFRVTETVKIAGEPDVMYSLVVTYDTTFDAEPNNDLSAASLRNITTTNNVVGHVDASGDPQDIFLIELTAGQPVTFSTKVPFDPELSPVNTLNPELELFDANGTSLASDLDSGEGTHSSLTFTPTADGTYSVRIAATEGAGEYLLTAKFEAATTETLTLTLSDQEFSENGGLSTATVTRSGDTSSALDVTVASSDATEAAVPTTVIIPAGASSVQFAIDAVDDSDADGTQTVSVNVSATGFTAASATIDVTDDDVATGVIHFSDIPVGQKGSDFFAQYGISRVSVNAGEPLEVFAEQGPDQTHQLNPGSGNYLGQRNPSPFSDRTMTFEFADGLTRFAFRRIGGSNNSSAPYWSATARNSAGQVIGNTIAESGNGFFLLREDAHFEIAAPDGETISSITFEIDSQLSTFGVVPMDDIELTFDAHAAALSLFIAEDSIAENDGRATATLVRNSAISEQLVVTLVSSDETEATVPATVTIPAGQESLQFEITAVNDEFGDASQTVRVEAFATGLIAGSATITVNDDEGFIQIGDGIGGGPSLPDDVGYGASVANIGDLNNDDIDDLAVGAPHNGGDTLFIHFMNIDGTSEGHAQYQRPFAFGRSVTAIGDLDGDGINEIFVGAYAQTGTRVGTTHDDPAGYVLFLNADGTVKSETTLTPGVDGVPGVGEAHFGTSVTALDDMDGDGIPDIAVGQIGITSRGWNHGQHGWLHILYLNADGSMKDSATIHHPNAESHARFGSAVTVVGDVNSDGVPDLAVGAEAHYENLTNAGAVHILFMNEDDTVQSQTEIVAPVPRTHGLFGSALASPGDLDGDSVPDLLVGAAEDQFNDEDYGSVFVVFLNADGTARESLKLRDLEGDWPERVDDQNFGSSLALLGDPDGDGNLELAIGASGDDPVYGPNRGAVFIVDLPSFTAPSTLSLDISNASIIENGGQTTATITRNAAMADDLVVMLTSNNADEATVPATVTILAGEMSATFEVSAVDDSVANGDATVTISAAADGYETIESTIVVEDDDNPELTVSIAADSIIENAGTDAATATVARNTPTDQPLTVSLSSSDTSEAAVSGTVTIPAGASSVQFAIDAVDDSDVDGDQTVTFEASATGFATGTATLDVIDNDSAGDPIVLLPSGPVSFLRPEIVWTQVAGAVSYEVWLERIGGEANPILNPTVETTSFVPDSDLGIGSFRAWVRANFSDGSRSGWDASSFRIDAAAVIDDLPFHGADRTPTITWPAQAGADSYRVYIANVTANSVVLDDTVTTNSFTPDTDFEFGKHRIWVRGISEGGFQARWSRSIDYYIGPNQIDAVRSTTDTTPTFQWESLPNIASMQLYVSQGSNVLLNQSGLSDAATITTELDEGFYRWWIRPTHTNGRLGEWSPMGRLEIGDRPIVIAPEYNTNDSTVQVAWGELTSAGSYEIYLYNDDTSSLVHRTTGITRTTYDYHPLPDGNYRVWIRSYTAAGAPDKWSRAHRFVIDATTSNVGVTLTSPLGSTFDESLTFEWTADNEAASYDFYASDGEISIEDFDLTETTYQSLFPLTTGPITWWVRAKTAAGEVGPWIRGEADISARPQIVALPGPVTEARPTIQWQPVAGAVRYDVYISNLDGLVIRDDTVTDTEFVPGTDLVSGEHRVWIQAISADGLRSPWSTVSVMDVQLADEAIDENSEAAEILTNLELDSADTGRKGIPQPAFLTRRVLPYSAAALDADGNSEQCPADRHIDDIDRTFEGVAEWLTAN